MQMIWAKLKLTAPCVFGGRFKMLPLKMASTVLRQAIERQANRIRSYQRLAAVYHEYARSFCPDYVSFLKTLSKRHHCELRAVLDLACGAGTLTVQLASLAPRVVGVDRSPEMIDEAQRRCAGLEHVRFVRADFRDFDLADRFDSIVCASDSLNYIETTTELDQVLDCVARHLAPRGLFVGDALDDRGFRMYSGKFIPIQWNGTDCNIVLQYDAATRVSQSLVVFGSEVETHRRIPIEPDQMLAAAGRCGLTVLDWFSVAGFGLFKYGGVRNFYVLQKAA